MKKFTLLIILSSILVAFMPESSYKIAVLKYNGGGDWYANLETSLPNLIEFSNQTTGLNINPKQGIVEPSSAELYKYPFLHMTGHGNVVFNESERENLKTYLLSGGFLHIDDNYGMNDFIKTEMLKVFPDKEWVKIGPQHPIFKTPFEFPKGLPKIHEHDNQPPEAYAIMEEGKMLVFYTYEADLGDGWEDLEIHNDLESKHVDALKMGTNILYFAFVTNNQNKIEYAE